MTLSENAKLLLANHAPDASPGDIAEKIPAIGSAYALRFDDKLGDVAFDRRMPLLADRWGVGASKPRDARRLIEAHPGCLIGIRCRTAAVVIDCDKRSVRAAREIIRVERSF